MSPEGRSAVCSPAAILVRSHSRGLRAPVRAWRVLGEHIVDDRFAALRGAHLAPLVDREEELALLLHRWRQARAGKGQLVMLTGEPGIGKSRLAVELRARLRGEPHAVLRYFCSPHHQASPLYPVIARWEHDAGFVRSDGPADKLRKLEAVLQPQQASPEDIWLIADLLGVPAGGAYPQLDLSPQRKKLKTFEALTGRAVALVGDRPLLLLVEDVHWADPSSLELLDRMIGLLSDLPILLLISFRPEFVPAWTGPANATLLTLGRLNRHDALRLATEVTIGQVLQVALLDRIVTQSDGIPLFIEELAGSALRAPAAGVAAQASDQAERRYPWPNCPRASSSQQNPVRCATGAASCGRCCAGVVPAAGAGACSAVCWR